MEIMIIGDGGNVGHAVARVLSQEQWESIEASVQERGIKIVTDSIHDLKKAFETVTIKTGKSTIFADELNRLAEEMKQQSIVYDKPQSKFMSMPKNNFRKR